MMRDLLTALALLCLVAPCVCGFVDCALKIHLHAACIPTHMADTIRKNVVDSLREAMGVPKGAAPCVPSGDVVRGLDAGMTWAAMDYFPEPGEDEPRTAQEEREFNAAYEWVRRLARAKDGA